MSLNSSACSDDPTLPHPALREFAHGVPGHAAIPRSGHALVVLLLRAPAAQPRSPPTTCCAASAKFASVLAAGKCAQSFANLMASPQQSQRFASHHSIGACLTASAEDAGGRRSSNSKHAVAKQTTNMNLKSLA